MQFGLVLTRSVGVAFYARAVQERGVAFYACADQEPCVSPFVLVQTRSVVPCSFGLVPAMSLCLCSLGLCEQGAGADLSSHFGEAFLAIFIARSLDRVIE